MGCMSSFNCRLVCCILEQLYAKTVLPTGTTHLADPYLIVFKYETRVNKTQKQTLDIELCI